MGNQICSITEDNHNRPGTPKHSPLEEFANGEENIIDLEDEVTPSQLHIKVFEARSFQDKLFQLRDFEHSSLYSKLEEQYSNVSNHQWFKEWVDIFSHQVKEKRLSRSGTVKIGVETYQNYFKSFLPKYKDIVIKDQNFFKIREEPITKFYTMEAKIGEGGFGSVYQGKCNKTGEKRAIKILKRKFMNQNDYQLFTNEVNILKKMDHINIIKIYDIFSYQSFFYVVTEYCGGGSLLDVSHTKIMKDPKMIKILMRQLISAVSYIHRKSFVHRDLKLENIVLVENIQKIWDYDQICIKIIDFGLAAFAQKSIGNKCGTVGTPSYMAPEILQGSFCFQSDVWSCGIILCLMLFGHNPFKQKRVRDTYRNILKKEIDFLNDSSFSNCSMEARVLLKKMLIKVPSKRLASDQILTNPWFSSIIETSHKKMINKAQSVVENFNSYSRGSNFTCFIKNYLISKKITQAQRQELAIVFEKIDTDASGVIDKEELAKLYNLVTGLPLEEAEKHIKKVDHNKSEKIDFHEFLLVMTKDDIMHNKGYLSQAFEFFDQDKTGFIEKEELLECMVGCQEQEIISIIQSVDCNGDGLISRDEFCRYMLGLDL